MTPERPRYNPIPLILFLALLGGAVVWVMMREGKSSTPYVPPPPAVGIQHCFVSELAFDDAGAATVRVSTNDKDFNPLPRDGTLTMTVSHTEPRLGPPTYPPPEATTVCQLTGTVSAAEADGGIWPRVVATAPCPSVAPPGRVIQIEARFLEGDAGDHYCEYSGPVPAAVGGRDRSVEAQSADAMRGAIAHAKPAEYGAIMAYLETLARAAPAIDPSVSPKVVQCPSEVKGTAAVFTYETLSKVVAPYLDGGALRPPALDSQKVAYVDLVSSSGAATGLVPVWATADGVTKLAPKIDAVGRWVIVLTSLGTVAPLVEIPERMSGQSVVEAHFTPGSYQGGMFVLDRESGKVVCSAPVAADSGVTKLESTNPNDLYRMVRGDLATEVRKAWTAKLSRIAPALSPETP